jgi:hypothetical protein
MTREERAEVRDVVNRFNKLPLNSQILFLDLLMTYFKKQNARITNNNTAGVHRIIKRKDKAPRTRVAKPRVAARRKKM